MITLLKVIDSRLSGISVMNYKLGFRALKKDIFDNKQIALFLGAGVNSSAEIKLMWTQLLNPILKSALYRFSAEKGLSDIQLKE